MGIYERSGGKSKSKRVWDATTGGNDAWNKKQNKTLRCMASTI